MNNKMKATMMALALMLTMTSSTACASRHHHHAHARPAAVTPPPPPGATSMAASRYNIDSRRGMALDYLSRHHYLTVDSYAAMTGLSHSAAEAELDAFARDRHTPIRIDMRGKRKFYTR